MEKKDILHLARLSRIAISDEEAEAFTKEIDSVLSYVSVVDSITADSSLTKKVGARFNMFREDVVTNEPESHTKALLAEAPKTKGRHLAVKKILQAD
jgi:aspartyl-tRNA(Asn)/glutamyl-tRNA(Gln) amidotransferase subunit C